MEPNTQEPKAPKKTNRTFLIVLIVLVAVGSWFGITKYRHSQHHEETDDAQIEAKISPAIPRISGYIKELRVSDNQLVKKGDTLMILDDRDLRLKLAQAEAALATAQSSLTVAHATSKAASANIASAQAGVSTIDAQIETAKVNVWRTTEDLKRYDNLIKDHSITQQQYEQQLAAKQTAERQLQVLMEQKKQASSQTGAVATQSAATASQIGVASATIKQKEVDVEDAKLSLSYTVVIAPESGRISKVNVQEGQFVTAGQSFFSIVLDERLWVVANFKETQLDRMRVGQKVLVKADAFPNHEFEATITSFAAATGARFAVLPPDNSSGNFVKVVQRLPVKIEFAQPSDSLVRQLRAGMNVIVDVHLD